MLLTVIGSNTYALLSSLLTPAKPGDKSFAVLSETLRCHFDPKPLVIVERFHFHRRNQASSESISEYVTELRRLATHCEFGDYLEQALRDRLVCGIRHENTQKRLLSESELSLIKGQLQWKNNLCSYGSLLIIVMHGINYFFIICLD